MSPSRKNKRQGRGGSAPRNGASSAGGSNDWAVAMYLTADDDVPSARFLLSCPGSVHQMLLAIIVAVQQAPPPSFPPSNMWHVMHDEMRGFHEARDEHDGNLYRLFCVLDRHAPDHGLDAPVVALISGGVKRARTKMDAGIYKQALAYRKDYLATRRILLPPGIAPEVMGR